MRWQLNLYKDIAMRSEGPPDPERVVDRIQRISAAVFNLEQVGAQTFIHTPTYCELQVTLEVLVLVNKTYRESDVLLKVQWLQTCS